MQVRVVRLSAAVLAGPLLAVVISARTPSVHARGTAFDTASTASVLKLGTTSSVEAGEQLREALRHPRPEIRAVAARAVWMSRNAALVPTIAAALQEEQVAFAAREQIRALAAADTRPTDQAVFDAWKTFGVGFAADSALMFAQARGPSAIAALPRLREAAIDPRTQMAFVLVATRREAAALTAAASHMLETKDWPSLRLVLDTSDVVGTAIGVKVLTAVLASADEPARVTALWYLLGADKVSDGMRAAMRAAVELGAPSGSPDAVLVMEFAGRLLGKAARTDPAWREVLAAPHPDLELPLDPVRPLPPPELPHLLDHLSWWFTKPLVANSLTKPELITLRDVYAPRANKLESLLPPKGASPNRNSSYQSQRPSTRLASGFPPALVSDVLADTGCTPDSKKKDARAGARITAAPDGRVRIDLSMAHDASLPCIDAATTLLKAFVAEPLRDGRHVPQQVVLLPLSKRYIECANRETGPLAPPDAPPRMSADRQRRLFTGTSSPEQVSVALLISSTGCLHDLIILSRGSDKTHWSMIKQTVNESFEPTPVASRLSIGYLLMPTPDPQPGGFARPTTVVDE